MDWLDSHAGSVQAMATLVLVALTGYYAWASQSLVRETRATLASAARATLQERMDRISEILMREPDIFTSLDDTTADGSEMDARFHISNMFLSVLEEAHTQRYIERSMPEEDWRAWVATADAFLVRHYVSRYWQRVHPTFEPSFQQFVQERLQAAGKTA
jgi:hypothetical protein